MNPRLVKAKNLAEVLLLGEPLTTEQAQAIIFPEELSRVIEVIRCRLYIPVTCCRDKPTSYSITPDDIHTYKCDRSSQIAALKTKRYAKDYNRIKQRIINKATTERGGIARAETMLNQVQMALDGLKQAGLLCDEEEQTQ